MTSVESVVTALCSDKPGSARHAPLTPTRRHDQLPSEKSFLQQEDCGEDITRIDNLNVHKNLQLKLFYKFKVLSIIPIAEQNMCLCQSIHSFLSKLLLVFNFPKLFQAATCLASCPASICCQRSSLPTSSPLSSMSWDSSENSTLSTTLLELRLESTMKNLVNDDDDAWLWLNVEIILRHCIARW